MTDPKRLREMIAISSFEGGRGREAMDIAGYYRSDYIARQMIRTFFLATFGIIGAAGIIAAANAEALLNLLVYLDMVKTIGMIVLIYLVLIAATLIMTFVSAYRRYSRAERERNVYAQHVRNLAALNEKYDASAGAVQERRT